MTKEEATLGMVQAVLNGKIEGFKQAMEHLGDSIFPETKSKITFAITELEEVLKVIKDSKQ